MRLSVDPVRPEDGALPGRHETRPVSSARSGLRSLLVGLALLCAIPVQASALRLEAANGHPSLAGHLSFLLDRSGKMTFDEAVAQGQSGGFAAITGNEVNAGYLPASALWVRFTLDRDAAAPAEWWLNIPQHTLDHIDLYIQQPDGTYALKHGGRAQPFAQRELNWHGHAFRLALDGVGEQNIYLRFASLGPLRPPLDLWQEREFERFRAIDNFIFGMYFGIMGVAFLIGLFRALRHRSVVDGLYALYIISLETANFLGYGYFQQFGLSDNLTLQLRLEWFSTFIAGLSLMWFALKLIEWPPPVLRRLNLVAVGATAGYLLMVMTLLLVAPDALHKWVRAIAILLGISALATSLWAAVRGWKGGLAFVLAFSPFVILMSLLQSGTFGIVQGTWQMGHAYLAGSVFHAIVLFSIILNRDAGYRRLKDKLEWEVSNLNVQITNKAMFLRMLTHEVRTPLAVIDSNCQLIAIHKNDQQETKQQVDTIRAAVVRLAELLDRCLAQDRLALIERANRKPVKLAELISGLVEEVQRGTDDHLMTCRIEGLTAPFPADPLLLRIMLTNLLENAVRYSPEGGNITVSAQMDAAKNVVIEVADEGVGVSPDDLDHIFERYYRTQQVSDAVGAGLGLYIVENIASLHGGDVRCKSVLGEGSVFRITLRR